MRLSYYSIWQYLLHVGCAIGTHGAATKPLVLKLLESLSYLLVVLSSPIDISLKLLFLSRRQRCTRCDDEDKTRLCVVLIKIYD